MLRLIAGPRHWWNGLQKRFVAARGWVGYAPDDPRYNGAGPVVRAEVEQYLSKRRAEAENKGKHGCYNDLTGIAISGGGVRSAVFALGVLQAFAYKNWLNRFDYLSTVSGGGYIGTALTWLLSRDWVRATEPGVAGGKLRFGLNPCDFPFSTDPLWAGDKELSAAATKLNRYLPTRRDNGALLRFLRQNANYLAPGGGITRLSLLAAILRSTSASLAIYVGLLACIFFALQSWQAFELVVFAGRKLARPLEGAWYALLVFAGMIAVYTVTSRWRCYSLRRAGDVIYPYVLKALAALLVLGSLPHVHDWLRGPSLAKWLSDSLQADWLPSLVGLASTLLGALFGAGAYRQTTQVGRKGALFTLLVVAGVALLLYGIALLAYSIAQAVYLPDQAWTMQVGRLQLSFAWGVGVLVLIAVAAELNYLSMHRYYRDRLLETFMPNVPAVLKVEGGMACGSPKANSFEISETYTDRLAGLALADPQERVHPSCCAPYHLINTNVVLAGSRKPKFRGRGGDNFVLSPLFCGSNATGWRDSKQYMGKKLSLATAMAVSGAAVNPNTGVGGEGPTRQPLLSILMRLLNIRLGVWVPNPNPLKGVGRRRPNFLHPGFSGLPLGSGLRETNSLLELTDGGHFENLGLYELVRRRLRLIVAIDGAADPDYSFGDLANAIEKVRTDFGVLIDIDDADLKPLVSKRLESTTTADAMIDRRAQRGYLVADILYPDSEPGLLVYISTTYASQLSADLYGYRHAHREFPDEPTSDQFFDEKQFEAYRELGYQLTWNMFTELKTDAPKLLEKLATWCERTGATKPVPPSRPRSKKAET